MLFFTECALGIMHTRVFFFLMKIIIKPIQKSEFYFSCTLMLPTIGMYKLSAASLYLKIFEVLSLKLSYEEIRYNYLFYTQKIIIK